MAHAGILACRSVDHVVEQGAVFGHIACFAVRIFAYPGLYAQAQVTVFEVQRLNVGQCVGAVTIRLAVCHSHRTVAVGHNGVALVFAAVLHRVSAHIAPLVGRAVVATV